MYILCKCKKKKRNNKQEKHKHSAMKEQIPPFRIAFQKLDECWEAPEHGILLNNCQGRLSREVVSDLGSWKPCHNVVGWPAPVIKKSERHLVKVINASCFRCLKVSQISYGRCQSLFPLGKKTSPTLPLSVFPGGAVFVLPGAGLLSPIPELHKSPSDSHAL